MGEMKDNEILHIIIAIMVVSIVSGFRELINMNLQVFSMIVLFSAIIIGVNILFKKAMASRLDADVEHELWKVKRWGFNPGDNFKTGVLAGVIIPLFAMVVTLGSINLMTVMTYETRALKRRAAKRFGPYSFTEMTDYHNSLVGAAGIIGCLLITFIASFFWVPGDLWNTIGRMATFYAFFNMFPISKLDGSQIYFGSRVLWSVLAVITLISLLYAMYLV